MKNGCLSMRCLIVFSLKKGGLELRRRAENIDLDVDREHYYGHGTHLLIPPELKPQNIKSVRAAKTINIGHHI